MVEEFLYILSWSRKKWAANMRMHNVVNGGTTVQRCGRVDDAADDGTLNGVWTRGESSSRDGAPRIPVVVRARFVRGGPMRVQAQVELRDFCLSHRGLTSVTITVTVV